MKYIIIIYLLYREHSTAFDAVHVYALDILNLGLTYKGFHDAVKEGDGDRVIRYWKVLMVLFKETDKRNYSKEAFLLILQLHSLSERAATEVKWSWFVNRRGQIGCNIPCDLAMEHLNRRLKGIICIMGANVVPSALARAAKSIGSVDCVCDLFEQSVMTQQTSSKHTIAQDSKDFQLMLEILNEKKYSRKRLEGIIAAFDTHAPSWNKAGKKLFAHGYRSCCKSTLVSYLRMTTMMMTMMMMMMMMMMM